MTIQTMEKNLMFKNHLLLDRTPNMKLPDKHKTVSLKEIKAICEEYGLPELWERIKKNHPKRPFKSDG